MLELKSDYGIENLRYAIVKQACVDYENSLRYLRRHKKPKTKKEEILVYKNKKLKNECEKFFRSTYYALLCDIEGEHIMKTIRSKYYNRPIRWRED